MNTVLSHSNPQPTTRLHIQHVVLDGAPFGTVDAGTLQAGLVQELSRLLTLSSSSDWSSCAAVRLYAPPVALVIGGGSAAWGHQIARALMTTLNPKAAEQLQPVASINGSKQVE